MVGNIVLGAPVFVGQNTGFLFMEDRSSLGKIGLVKSLVSVHERRPVVQNRTLSGTILGCYRCYSFDPCVTRRGIILRLLHINAACGQMQAAHVCP